MKKSTKISMIVATCLIALGALIFFAAFVVFDFDISRFSTDVEYENVTYVIEDEFTSIEVDDIESDINIYPTEGKCTVVTNESEYIKDSVEVENGRLIIKRQDTRKWYQRIQISFSFTEEVTLSLYLPKSEYESLKLKAVSGDITVPEGFTFVDTDLMTTSGDINFSAVSQSITTLKSTSGNINVENTVGGTVRIKATSGDLKISSCKAQNLNVETLSGEIRLTNAELGALSLKTTSGDMNLNNLTLSGNISFNTTSGEVELCEVIAKGELEIEAVSGDIDIEDSDAASIDIKTVSGDVRGTLLSPKNFIYSTTSGNVRFPASSSESGECRVKTTSGDIKLSLSDK